MRNNKKEIERQLELLDLKINAEYGYCCSAEIEIADLTRYLEERWEYGREAFHNAMRNVICGNENDIYRTIIVTPNKQMVIMFFDQSHHRNMEGFEENVRKAMDRASSQIISVFNLEIKFTAARFCTNINV